MLITIWADVLISARDALGTYKWGSNQKKNYVLNKGSYKVVLSNLGKLNILDPSGETVWVNP